MTYSEGLPLCCERRIDVREDLLGSELIDE